MSWLDCKTCGTRKINLGETKVYCPKCKVYEGGHQ